MQIDQVMTKDIKTVSPSESVKKAASFMLSEDTGSIPVCDGDRLVGMITDRDVAVRGISEGKDPDCAVSELMSKDPVRIRSSEDVESAARKMSECQVRRLPVIDDSDRLVGMVSLGDIARQTDGEAEQIALEGVSERGELHKQS
ncbi:CBS domain-containing protein [Sphingomicrobium astaxanthinifaciens]|uniref:CBS domain-containing protein n=1 Tax=Sphingomicrobium astaxanthinifaciens TaxID=1227949 RepID=UPI001FCB5E9C|nr:CBS domain-containing protein [Sphingomicrobium astaxanthinifaciens]MCJ7421946.1 CBS domain-containing protein [Sphingomicrobium astaxanthinifaciens]